jgi:hypothetical protein
MSGNRLIKAGHTEIRDLGVPVRGDQNICGFNVAVDYSVRVSVSERIGNFTG